MGECTPTAGGRWPSTSPCGLHGSCVPATGGGYMCLCDDGWSSSGDFSQAPRVFCQINQPVLLSMWSLALVCVLVIVLVWWRVVQAYMALLAEAERKARHDAEPGTSAGRPTHLASTNHAQSQFSSGGDKPIAKSKPGSSLLKQIIARLHWLWTNPTRRTLTLCGAILLCYIALALIKIIEIGRHIYDGSHGTASTSRQNVGFAVAPTLFYCLGSYGFLVGSKLSSLIWCASAQAFYPRAEGLLLRKNTIRELLMGSCVDLFCYILPVVSCVLADYYLDSTMRSGDLDSYEIVLALHFQFKGISVSVAFMCDYHVARRFMANLREHAATQERLQVKHTIKRTQSPTPSQGMTTTTAVEMSTAVSRGRLTAVAVTPAVATTQVPAQSNVVSSIAAQVTAAAARNARRGSSSASGSNHRRSRSVSVDRPQERDQARLSRRNISIDVPPPTTSPGLLPPSRRGSVSPAVGGGGVIGGGEVVSDYSPSPSPDLKLTSAPLDFPVPIIRQPVPQRIIIGESSVHPLTPASSGPVITDHRAERRATASVAPTPATEDPANGIVYFNVPGQVIAPNPRRVTATVTSPPTVSLPNSPQSRTGSFAVELASHLSNAISPQLPSPAPPADDQLALLPQTRQTSDPTPSSPSASAIGGPISPSLRSMGVGNLVRPIPKIAPRIIPNARRTTGEVATVSSPSALGAPKILNPRRATASTNAFGSLSPSASASPSAPMRSQADLQSEHRAKLNEFLARLLKHNKSSFVLSTIWLIFNSLFAWIPLLRGFAAYVLPLQLLISLRVIRTLLYTLSPKTPAATTASGPGISSGTATAVPPSVSKDASRTPAGVHPVVSSNTKYSPSVVTQTRAMQPRS